MDNIYYTVHPLSEPPTELQNNDHTLNCSYDMVIDMDGRRKHFQIAWFDFDDKQWHFHEDDTSLLIEKHAKWMDILPHNKEVRTFFCSYCKRSYGAVKDDLGNMVFPMHALNPKKPVKGHCNGSGRIIK